MTAFQKIGIKGTTPIILNKAAFCALVRHLLLSDGASSRFCKRGARPVIFGPSVLTAWPASPAEPAVFGA